MAFPLFAAAVWCYRSIHRDTCATGLADDGKTAFDRIVIEALNDRIHYRHDRHEVDRVDACGSFPGFRSFNFHRRH
jgi:hypothetical protein